MSVLIDLKRVSARLNGVDILSDINFQIEKGQHWAIVGESGSDKTSLANAIIGRIFHSGEVLIAPSLSIQLIQQQHRFKTLSNTSDFYYQQRFQSQDSEDSLTIEQELEQELAENYEATQGWLKQLKLDNKLLEPLIQLSNGENKRLQLVKSLLHQPDILILDNPFVGLDVEGRSILHTIIEELASKGIHLVIITNTQNLPSCITNILQLEKGKQVFCGLKKDFSPDKISWLEELVSDQLVSQIPMPVFPEFDIAIKMVDVTVKY